MRILLAATSTLPDRMGGSERVIWHLAHGLSARGHEARILVPRTTRGVPPASTIKGVQIVRYDDPLHSFATLYLSSLWLGRAAVRAILRAWRPDVIHAHQGLAGLAATWADARPLCYTFYGPWHLEFLHEVARRSERAGLRAWTRPMWMPAKAALARRIERIAVRRSSRVVVLSNFSARQLVAIHQVADAKIALIPGGVDLNHFRPALPHRRPREALGLPSAGPLLFTVRRLVPRMGLEVLLRALQKLPRAMLVIGGSGWLRPTLEASAAALGLAERVRFVGFIEDEELPTYYQAADLVVLPSVALEGFGLIALEALACGTPVVATPDSGTRDVLEPFEPAWLAADATPESLADAIARTLERVVTEPSLSERCRAHAAGYAWERVVEQYEALYRSLKSVP